jgi:hypothetical protein
MTVYDFTSHCLFFPMQVSLRFSTETYSLQLNANPSVQQLQTEVRRATGIPPTKQHLIFKGKVLGKKKDKLSAYGIGNASKILLLVQDVDSKDDAPARRPARAASQHNIV